MASRRRFGSVAATAAVVVVVGASSAWADQPGQGEFPTEQAEEKCFATIDRQIASGVSAGGGPKVDELGPVNCDHFFGAPGKP